MNNHIFGASLTDIDDADQILREVRGQIDAAVKARGHDGSGVAIMLHPGGDWSVSYLGGGFGRLSTYGHESLVDALHASQAKVETLPPRWTPDQIARTLGIEPPLSEAAELGGGRARRHG